MNPADRFATAISAVGALAEALRPAPDAMPVPRADVAMRPLPVRQPSSPALGSSDSNPLFVPEAAVPAAPVSSAAVSRTDGSPQGGDPSTRMGAMGVTVPRSHQSGRGIVVAAVAGIVALVGAVGVFAMVRQKSPAGTTPVLLAVELSALPPPTTPSASAVIPAGQPSVELLPPATALSAPSVAPTGQPPIAAAAPESPSASAMSSASSTPPPSGPPTVLVPDAGQKVGAKSWIKPRSEFEND